VIARLEASGANPRLATLEKVIAATGHQVDLDVRPVSGESTDAGVDETLITASLRESPAQRLRQFDAMYKFAQRYGGRALAANGS
jgi:hypothetical protein